MHERASSAIVSACASSSSVESIGAVRYRFHDIVLLITVSANF